MSSFRNRLEKAAGYIRASKSARIAEKVANKFKGSGREPRGVGPEQLKPEDARIALGTYLRQLSVAQQAASPQVEAEAEYLLKKLGQNGNTGQTEAELRQQIVAAKKGAKKERRVSPEAYTLVLLLLLFLLTLLACSNPESSNTADTTTQPTVGVVEDQAIEAPAEEPTVGPKAVAAPEAATAEAPPEDETPNIEEWLDAAQEAGATPEATVQIVDDELAYTVETIDDETIVIVLTKTPDGIVSSEVSLLSAIEAAEDLSTPENTIETPTGLEVVKDENGDAIVFGIVGGSSGSERSKRVVSKRIAASDVQNVSWQVVSNLEETPESLEAETQETEESPEAPAEEDTTEAPAEEETVEAETPVEEETQEPEPAPAVEAENKGPSLEAAQAFNPDVDHIASGGTQYGLDSDGGVVAVFNQETNKWEELGLSIDQIVEVSSSGPNWTGGFSILGTVGKMYFPEGGKDLGGGNTSLVMIDVLTVYKGKIQVGMVSIATKTQSGQILVNKSRFPAAFDSYTADGWLGIIAKKYWFEHTTEEEKASGLYDPPDLLKSEGKEAYVLYYNDPSKIDVPRITPGDTLSLSFKPVGVDLISNPETREDAQVYDPSLNYAALGPGYEDPRISGFMNDNDFSMFDDGSGEIPFLPAWQVEFFRDNDHIPTVE